MILQPGERVSLVAAGPDLGGGELLGEEGGEAFDGKSLAGVMAGQEEGDAAGFGVVTGVETCFAGDEELAAASDGEVEEFTGTAAGDGDAGDGALEVADGVEAGDF